jgi:alpha-mannosidase
LVNYPKRLEIGTLVRAVFQSHPDDTLIYHFVLALISQHQRFPMLFQILNKPKWEMLMLHKIYWTPQKINIKLRALEAHIHVKTAPIADFEYALLDSPEVKPPLTPDERSEMPKHPLPANSYWGSWQKDFILWTEFSIPPEWDLDSTIALHLPIGVAGDFEHPEALIYIDERAVAACDRHHQTSILPKALKDHAIHRLVLHGWTGLGPEFPMHSQTQLFMKPCALVQLYDDLYQFVRLARVCLQTIEVLDELNPVKHKLLTALDACFRQLDTREVGHADFSTKLQRAWAILNDGITSAGLPLEVDLYAIGHAHIDVAWLWTVAQSRRKAGRTFHTVLHLMEQFPEYRFTQSQPQLYDYVRQDYPELFKRIQQAVQQGQWETIGGMWVEADCNISGAEALARQFLLGRHFFTEHFGPSAETPVLWLPDVFGYPASLPQLIKQAGLNYFFTIKIGWNQYNRIPYDSFYWQGLDGTRILTHFSTTPEAHNIRSHATYNAEINPLTMLGTWLNIQHKDIQQEALVSYGWGDGGGGPTQEMIENIRLLAAFPGLPRIHYSSVRQFFERLAAKDGWPIWIGELYLEFHRGTYTTQSRNKRANRKMEFLLHDVEVLASMASLIETDYVYPDDELDKAWKLLCLNQFHDILPGSSITSVYEVSQKDYATIQEIGNNLRTLALQTLHEALSASVLVINPTGFARSDLVEWKGDMPDGFGLYNNDGMLVPIQKTETGTLLYIADVQPYSVMSLYLRPDSHDSYSTHMRATPTSLENYYLRVDFDENGDIVRIFDKVNRRDVLPPGQIADQFQAFEDRPMNWPAWDIDSYFEEVVWYSTPADSITVVEHGPLRATLAIKRRIGQSVYTQSIWLEFDKPHLHFHTQIDWREKNTLLKVAFPIDVLSDKATYEIQWGNVERPTHRNTSWDWARFEVCGHKWVDLSEGNYGVSLLNDCKYGFDVYGNVIRMSLLRGSTYPDPYADEGFHEFSYALLPHAGRWDENTIASAYALNDPLILSIHQAGVSTDNTPPSAIDHPDQGNLLLQLVHTSNPNIVIETIKRAEDGQGYIIRLYEAHQWRGPITLTVGFPIKEVWKTNLLEENQEEVLFNQQRIHLSIAPFAIVSLRVLPE